MSEIPAPYGPQNSQSPAVQIARVLDDFLVPEILAAIQYPPHLCRGPYRGMDIERRREWFEFTFQALFRDAAHLIVPLLGRALKVPELGLIRRRIVNFLKQSGFEHEKG